MNLIESQTFLNLAKAYSGECQAQNRYKFIEYGARMEGYNCLAQLVDKVIYNEFNHARMFYTFIQKASKTTINNIDIDGGTPFKQKWDLVENLKFAAEDEADEVALYKEFAKTAKDEGFPEIEALFKMTADVEVVHKKLFLALYEHMKNGTLYKRDKPTKWRCTGCGYEHTAEEAFKICPLCQAKQGQVEIVL